MKKRTPGEQRPQRTERNRPRALKWAVIGILAVGVVAIAVSVAGQDPPASTTVVQDPDVLATGQQLYQANCAACHGPDLNGTAVGPPFLDVIYAPNHHGDESFQRAAAYGVEPHHWDFGPMPAVVGLTRDDVGMIIEYVRSEQEAAGIFVDPSH